MSKSSDSVIIVGCPAVSHADGAKLSSRWWIVDEAFEWRPELYGDKLAVVELALGHGNLVLRAPGMLRLDVPIDVIEDDDSVFRQATIKGQTLKVVDEGDLAAVWFGNVIGQPCRFVKVHPDESAPAI
jgi:hypothetical protein